MATVPVESASSTLSEPQARLRVGVLLDSLTVPKWGLRLLETIETSPMAELAVIVTFGDRPSVHKNGISKALQFWLELDRRLFAHRSATPDIDCPVLFRSANGCLVVNSHGDRGIDEQVEKQLRSMQLDVFLNLSSADAGPELQGIAKYGLCWFNDDAQLWEELFWWLSNETVIENKINVASSHQSAKNTISTCYSPSDKYSLFRSFGVATEKRITAFHRYLAQLGCAGQIPDSTRTNGSNSAHAPGTRETAGLILRLVGRILRDQSARLLRREDWFIAFRERHPQSGGQSGLDDLNVLRSPAGHFYADPFVIERDGNAYMFFEDYSYDKRKGVISFVELSGENCSAPQVAIEEDYHLSFPNVFEWRGEIYLLPESKNNHSVQLYRAVEFPVRWELSHVLLQNVSAVDSTLLRYQDRFWLFTCGLNSHDPWYAGDGELFLFSANTLNGPWVAHPKNPIVADVRDCRSAGQIIQCGNQLIRPAQDCSNHYGGAVVFNRIEMLSDRDYRETPVARVSADWLRGNRGTHTFNCSSRYEVVDGRTLVGRFWPTHSQPRLERATLPKVNFFPF